MFETPTDLDCPKTPEQRPIPDSLNREEIEQLITDALFPVEILPPLKINKKKKKVRVKIKIERSSFKKKGIELKEKLTNKLAGWKIIVRLGEEIKNEKEDEEDDLLEFTRWGNKALDLTGDPKGDPNIKNAKRFL
jgi:hypothetical protein